MSGDVEYAKSKGPVVHVMRQIKDVVKYLGVEGVGGNYGCFQSPRALFQGVLQSSLCE